MRIVLVGKGGKREISYTRPTKETEVAGDPHCAIDRIR